MGIRHIHDNTLMAARYVPMCAACGRIRDGRGRWHKVEPLLCEFEPGLITHTICPVCLKRLYPAVARRLRRHKLD